MQEGLEWKYPVTVLVKLMIWTFMHHFVSSAKLFFTAAYFNALPIAVRVKFEGERNAVITTPSCYVYIRGAGGLYLCFYYCVNFLG